MKRTVHFHARWLYLLLASSFLLFQACEQEEIIKEEIPKIEIPSCDENTTESNFFSFSYISERNKNLIGTRIYTDEQKILIQEKIQDIRVDNCRERFVSGVVFSLGYFVWDRAMVGEKSDGTIGIVTPSVHANADTLASVLVAEKKEDFSYYRIVKKDVLERLQVQETPELLERLQFLESIEKDLFGEKRPIGIEEDDFYLLGQLEGPQIESRSIILQTSECRAIAIKDEEEVESRSCPPGTVEFIDIVVVPCGGNDGNDSGDDGSCAFCDIDFGNGGSSGNGGDSDSDDDSNDTDFDFNGDPFDNDSADCSNPAACKAEVLLAVYKSNIINDPFRDAPFCGIQGRVSGRGFSVSDPYFHSEGRIECVPSTGGTYELTNTYSRGSNISVTNNDAYTNCTVEKVCGVAYWSWLLLEKKDGLKDISTPGEETSDICYDCRS